MFVDSVNTVQYNMQVQSHYNPTWLGFNSQCIQLSLKDPNMRWFESQRVVKTDTLKETCCSRNGNLRPSEPPSNVFHIIS